MVNPADDTAVNANGSVGCINRPEGVLRSRLSLRLMEATPKAASSASAFTRCFSDLPKRNARAKGRRLGRPQGFVDA